MLRKLDKNKYSIAMPFFQSYKDKLPSMITSVIEGSLEGDVYVDELSEPTTLIIKTPLDWLCIISNNEVKVKEDIINFIKKRICQKPKVLVVFGLSKEIIQTVENDLQKKFKTMSRIMYKLNEKKYNDLKKNYVLDDEYELKIIDESNIEEAMIVFPGIEEFWGSGDRFLRHGFGYLISVGDEIASVCASCFINDEMSEIDIFTKEKYRGKGFAYHISVAFIEHCKEKKLIPHWETVDLNKASCLLAEKLGYDRWYEYPFYVYFNQ